MVSKKPPPTPHQAVSVGGAEGVSSLDQGPEHASILNVRYSQGSYDTEQPWTRLRPRDTRADHIANRKLSPTSTRSRCSFWKCLTCITNFLTS